MNQLLPPPETIPVSWGWLKLMLMTVFPMHLLFMNAMIGSIVIAICYGVSRDENRRELSRRLAGIIPFLVAFAVNLGVASLLFIQTLYGRVFYTSSILMAAFWLAVIPLLMIAYYLLYLLDFRYPRLGRWGVLVAASALSIFMAIAFIYTNNMTLMLTPARWTAYLADQRGTILNLAESTLIPRYLHFMIGGTAMGGLFVALYGKFLLKREQQTGEIAVHAGMRCFVLLTLVQLADGLWFLQSIPEVIRRGFMGGDLHSTALLFIGVFLALSAAMTASVRGVYLTASMAVPLVFVMSSIRDRLRSAYLRPIFTPDTVAAPPQHSPMILFFCLLAAGAAVIVWMLLEGVRCSGGRTCEPPIKHDG